MAHRKFSDDPAPQLMHVQRTGIDHRIGFAAQRRDQLALTGNRFGQRQAQLAQRVPAASARVRWSVVAPKVLPNGTR